MATRTISHAGGNWNATTSWDEGSAAGSSDAVVARADGTSGNLVVNVNSACLSMDCTHYAGTLSFNAQLTITNNVTFVSGMGIDGTTGPLIIGSTSTMTSGTKTLTCPLSLLQSVTYTLADDWTVNGIVTVGATFISPIVNGNNLNCAGGLTNNCSSGFYCSGTTVFKLTGTGTWQNLGGATGYMRNNLTIVAGANTITIGTAVYYGTGVLTYTSGAMTVTSSTLSFVTSCTLDTSNMTWNNVTFGTASVTVTLNSNLVLSGTLLVNATTCAFSGAFTITTATLTWNAAAFTMSGNITASGAMVVSTSITFTGAYTIQAASANLTSSATIGLSGDIIITGTTTINSTSLVFNGATCNWKTAGLTLGSYAITGTATLVLTGGTWASSSSSGVVNTNLTIAGNQTISGSVYFAGSGNPTFTYLSGTPVVTSSTVVVASVTSTWNTAGMSFNNLTFASSGTFTITTNSLLTVGGTLTLPANYGFILAGTGGMSVINVTFVATTYTLNVLLTVTGTLTIPAGNITFAGTSGWTCATLANAALSSQSKTITLVAGNTYTVTTAMNLTSASGTIVWNIVSSTPGTKYIFTLNYGATQNCWYVNATDANSGAGQMIFTGKGTVTTCFNWSTSISSGNLLESGVTGAANTVSGVTYNKSGSILVSCDVFLFRDNGNNTAVYIGHTTSHGTTGAYSFTVYPGSTYFVVAFKNGSPNVFDTTDRVLIAS